MRRVDGLDSLPRGLPWPVVTVGTFDGVHVGHGEVLNETVRWARSRAGTAVVVTFEHPPRAFLDGENPPLLTTMPHRLLLMERLGVDLCLVLEFTRELADTPAADFVRTVLVDGLGVKGVVMGYGSAFGHNREGNEEFLRRHDREFGIEVRSALEATVDGEPVSSTRIRAAVTRGDLDLAARLLGRPVSVFGTVVRGEGRGRQLGFPTANLDLHHELAPPDGVYVARAVLDGASHPALASIGTRPTFAHLHDNEASGRLVEVYILDFDGQIYGRDLEAQFLLKLRGQERFPDVDALTAKMREDLEAARDYFARADRNPSKNP